MRSIVLKWKQELNTMNNKMSNKVSVFLSVLIIIIHYSPIKIFYHFCDLSVTTHRLKPVHKITLRVRNSCSLFYSFCFVLVFVCFFPPTFLSSENLQHREKKKNPKIFSSCTTLQLIQVCKCFAAIAVSYSSVLFWCGRSRCSY